LVLPKRRNVYPYKPLQNKKAEIRLLELLSPETFEDSSESTVHCKLHHVSLMDISPEHKKKKRTAFQRYHITRGKEDNKRHYDRPTEWTPPTKPYFNWGSYTALSYTWGDPKDSTLIVVDGCLVTVGVNLEAALRSLRKHSKFSQGLYLWADAICINQDDLEERSTQVAMMYLIFGQSDTVTIWLGSGNGESDAALDTIEKFAQSLPNSYAAPQIVEDVPRVTKATQIEEIRHYAITMGPAIVVLMDRSYWNRVVSNFY
jgi:hypothetical protein